MKTDLLIVGAGPFGLALAAQAQHERIEHLVVGKPMEFWRANMPKGMFLRSACDWHLDPQNVHTLEAYLQTQNKSSRRRLSPPPFHSSFTSPTPNGFSSSRTFNHTKSMCNASTATIILLPQRSMARSSMPTASCLRDRKST